MTFTTAHLRIIQDNPTLTDRQLGELIGATRDQVSSFRRRMGIRKCKASFSKIGALYGRGKKIIV